MTSMTPSVPLLMDSCVSTATNESVNFYRVEKMFGEKFRREKYLQYLAVPLREPVPFEEAICGKVYGYLFKGFPFCRKLRAIKKTT